MQTVYAVGHAALSAMGDSSQQHFEKILQQRSAIRREADMAVDNKPFYAARLLPEQLAMIDTRYQVCGGVQVSPFEQMCLFAFEAAVEEAGVDITSEACICILSTTKGNIEWLGRESDARILLTSSAEIIARYFRLKHRPLVVSNACISGSLALITAKRMIETGRYRHAVVIGCDRFSGFVFSGFRSFHALAEGPCRPFDKHRSGINLGEAAACMVLSADPAPSGRPPLAILAGGGVSNDANHLSGPSRTGAELAAAVTSALNEAAVQPEQIGMISAHGTATIFNDEMEAKALNLSSTAHAPLHSLKSYVGHTLGAAGVLESILACMAMGQGIQPASLGFGEPGVSLPVNVVTTIGQTDCTHLLKTASGFGGCNAAIVWQKTEK